MLLPEHFNMFHYIMRHVETTMLTPQVEILKYTFQHMFHQGSMALNVPYKAHSL